MRTIIINYLVSPQMRSNALMAQFASLEVQHYWKDELRCVSKGFGVLFAHQYKPIVTQQHRWHADNLASTLKVNMMQSIIRSIIINKKCDFMFSWSVVGVLPFVPYGDGSGPIVYSRVQCDGNETTLFNCQLVQASNRVCNRHVETFTIRCTDGEWIVTYYWTWGAYTQCLNII